MSINTVNSSAASLTRACSEALIQAVKSWIPENMSPSSYRTFSPSEVWQQRIEKIIAEASYLGFTRLLRLSRAIQSSLHRTQANSGALESIVTPLATESLANAWHAIRILVTQYEDSRHVDVASEVAGLKEVFGFTEEDLQNMVSVTAVEDLDVWKKQYLHSPQESDHVDTSVYRSAEIDTLDKCLEEETWIVSQLVALAEDLAAGTYSDRPAHKLMSILRRHRFFNRIDRVCLAGRVHDTNQLVVVDSSNSVRAGENTLKRGYSCFVNPEGSLFKMKPSTIRIFAECNRVLATFAEQRKPAQRSIALIADLGLRSGLCMSIGRGESVQGFLFLNSQEPALFDEITTRYAPLLSLVSIVATLAMDANGFHLDTFRRNSRFETVLPKKAILFDLDSFAKLFGDTMMTLTNKTYSVSVHSNVQGNNFLYSPSTVIGSIVDFVHRSGFESTNPVQILVLRKGNQITLKVRLDEDMKAEGNFIFLQRTVAKQIADLEHLPIHLELSASSLQVRFPYEPVLEGSAGQNYSIAY